MAWTPVILIGLIEYADVLLPHSDSIRSGSTSPSATRFPRSSHDDDVHHVSRVDAGSAQAIGEPRTKVEKEVAPDRCRGGIVEEGSYMIAGFPSIHTQQRVNTIMHTRNHQ